MCCIFSFECLAANCTRAQRDGEKSHGGGSRRFVPIFQTVLCKTELLQRHQILLFYPFNCKNDLDFISANSKYRQLRCLNMKSCGRHSNERFERNNRYRGSQKEEKKNRVGLVPTSTTHTTWWQRINTDLIQGARVTGKHSSKPEDLTAKVSQSSTTTNRPDTPTLAESRGYNVLFLKVKAATDR